MSATTGAVAGISGGWVALIAKIVFNGIATIVTTRNANGDYATALRALET